PCSEPHPPPTPPRSQRDARTPYPPIDAPTSAISSAPRERRSAFVARRSVTADHGLSGRYRFVLPVEPSYPRRFSASAGTPRDAKRGATSRQPEPSQF